MRIAGERRCCSGPSMGWINQIGLLLGRCVEMVTRTTHALAKNAPHTTHTHPPPTSTHYARDDDVVYGTGDS